MAFMVPQYTKGDFFSGQNDFGESVVGPASDWGSPDRFAEDTGADEESVERIAGRFWARLSAPGYLDCTEWAGPFDTIEDAREYIVETYDVDADTGDDIQDTEEESE